MPQHEQSPELAALHEISKQLAAIHHILQFKSSPLISRLDKIEKTVEAMANEQKKRAR